MANLMEQADELVPLLKALSDETRLRMVALLSHADLCVCHLTALLGLSQSTTSHHLAVLRQVGLVEDYADRHDARWTYYRLRGEEVRAFVQAMQELLRPAEENRVSCDAQLAALASLLPEDVRGCIPRKQSR